MEDCSRSERRSTQTRGYIERFFFFIRTIQDKTQIFQESSPFQATNIISTKQAMEEKKKNDGTSCFAG